MPKVGTGEYIDIYNKERLHSALDLEMPLNKWLV
jgi:hypothetical protein